MGVHRSAVVDPPFAVSCRGSRRAGEIAILIAILYGYLYCCSCNSCSFALWHRPVSQKVVNFERIHSIPGIIITTYITFLLRQPLGDLLPVPWIQPA